MTSLPRSVVIGTAGHIDHGKTMLVRALTGIDADRLPEEKSRGITIDLGFASFEATAPDGSPLSISFVDVPGHSDFIRNMLAGAGCVSAVVLVVAADEGIMPQTVEHVAICQLLGISQGITVVTKADSVDDSQLRNVTESIEKFLQGTFLDKRRSAFVLVSAATGEGIEELRASLVKLAMQAQPPMPDALLRLPLDRSFVMKGFGTVVTGTLLSGTIDEGQTLQLEPGGRVVRVRGLQTHSQPRKTAQPGSRVAVNLSGMDAADVHRGLTLVAPKTMSAVDVVDVEITLLENAPALKHRATVHFHALTSETMATVSLYGYEAVRPGAIRLARIKLSEPIVLIPGDRFVLRQPSPAGTIGGGRVLDAHPETRLRKAAAYAWLEHLKDCSRTQQIEMRIRRRKSNGISLAALSAETGLTMDAIRLLAGPALQSGGLLLIGGELLLDREAFNAATGALTAHLREARRAVRRSELRSRAALSPVVFDFAVCSLERERKVELQDETVSIFNAVREPAHAENEQLSAIAQAYEAAGLQPPSVVELAQRLNLRETEMRRFVTDLQRKKTIVRMGSDELFIHSAALQRLVEQVAALRGSMMDVGRFKQITGLSRKYAIPLLEYLDRQRVTRKQGDERLVL